MAGAIGVTDKTFALPAQLIMLIDDLRGQLRAAATAGTLDAARMQIAAAGELVEFINKLASEAVAEVGVREENNETGS
jgi:hypothetical protein